jgi:hypothetical protein
MQTSIILSTFIDAFLKAIGQFAIAAAKLFCLGRYMKSELHENIQGKKTLESEIAFQIKLHPYGYIYTQNYVNNINYLKV